MKKKIKMMMARLRANLFTGVLAFLPVVLTLYLMFILVSKINNLLVKITPKPFYVYITDDHYGLFFRLIMFFIILLLIAFIGALTKMYIGKQILRLSNKLINKIPILNKIYQAIDQISKAFFGQKKSIFKKVVLIEYPRNGIFSMGFLTGDARGEIQVKTEDKLYNIFIPTTPNPTSGMLVMIPEKNIMYLDMTVEQGMKLVILGGAVVPDYGNA